MLFFEESPVRAMVKSNVFNMLYKRKARAPVVPVSVAKAVVGVEAEKAQGRPVVAVVTNGASHKH